ncbi:hypothetical protein VZT92_017011 [Zoarces viviparus]|uniref:Uncharacterized protein n=1 Tax=Zoarces viviparus TaxID=48416 RepID=A0AAW1ERG7_ZOAVI
MKRSQHTGSAAGASGSLRPADGAPVGRWRAPPSGQEQKEGEARENQEQDGVKQSVRPQSSCNKVNRADDDFSRWGT